MGEMNNEKSLLRGEDKGAFTNGFITVTEHSFIINPELGFSSVLLWRGSLPPLRSFMTNQSSSFTTKEV